MLGVGGRHDRRHGGLVRPRRLLASGSILVSTALYQGQRGLTLAEWGIAKATIPHSLLARLVSKHTPSVRTSPIWG